jgi:hypothetical protein
MEDILTGFECVCACVDGYQGVLPICVFCEIVN